MIAYSPQSLKLQPCYPFLRCYNVVQKHYACRPAQSSATSPRPLRIGLTSEDSAVTMGRDNTWRACRIMVATRCQQGAEKNIQGRFHYKRATMCALSAADSEGPQSPGSNVAGSHETVSNPPAGRCACSSSGQQQHQQLVCAAFATLMATLRLAHTSGYRRQPGLCSYPTVL